MQVRGGLGPFCTSQGLGGCISVPRMPLAQNSASACQGSKGFRVYRVSRVWAWCGRCLGRAGKGLGGFWEASWTWFRFQHRQVGGGSGIGFRESWHLGFRLPEIYKFRGLSLGAGQQEKGLQYVGLLLRLLLGLAGGTALALGPGDRTACASMSGAAVCPGGEVFGAAACPGPEVVLRCVQALRSSVLRCVQGLRSPVLRCVQVLRSPVLRCEHPCLGSHNCSLWRCMYHCCRGLLCAVYVLSRYRSLVGQGCQAANRLHWGFKVCWFGSGLHWGCKVR